ncbi:MAG: SpoIIE family protein phosphatase [Bacteroidetes bacterium]|nr:SpoIIE family protein phosphatase [Bacteroidota bacterium]
MKKDKNIFNRSIFSRRLFQAVLLLLFPLVINGQRYNFSQYTIEDGLPSSEVVDILQDHFRYLWIATPNEGIIKFDGVEFRQFKESDGLISNYTQCIHRDSKGKIWIGTKKGISLYDGFKFFSFTKNEGLPDDEVLAIEEYQGELYVGTKRGGLAVFKGDGFSQRFGLNAKLSRNIRCLFADSKGQLWIGGDNGLSILKNDKITTYTAAEGLPDNTVNDITEIAGEIWVATNSGLVLVQEDGFKTYSVKEGLPSNIILSLTKDQDDNLWIGTAKGAAKLVDGKFVLYNAKRGFTNNPVNVIILDSGENAWFGTKGSGLFKYSGHAFTYYTREDGLEFDNITAVLVDKHGYRWYGSLGGGLYRMRNDTIVRFTVSDGLPSDQITSLCESKNGTIWIGTPAGLAKIERGKITSATGVELIDDNITCLYKDSTDYLWIGTKSGITAFDGVNSQNFSRLNGLISNNVRCISQSKDGSIWIGTFEGLSRFNLKEFLSYTVEDKDGLPSNVINSITPGPNGSMWIGTDKGLVKFKDDNFKVFNVKQRSGNEPSISFNNVSLLQFDINNCLWVGSMKGVDKIFFNPPQVEKKTGIEIDFIKHYDVSNGFHGMGTNRNASSVSPDGLVYFGTFKGVVEYNTEIDDYSSYTPKVIITNIMLGNKIVNWKNYTDSIERWTLIPKGMLVLNHDDNNPVFKFIGIDHSAPEKVKYSWRLNGPDKEGSWTPFEARHEAIYSNLPPGEYEFMVYAENADGEPEKKPTIFRFTILPPFWNTLWFKALVAISIALLIYGYIKLRERKLRQEREMLEQKVEERTEEVMEQKRQLEFVNLEMIAKNKEIEEKNTDLNSSIRYALTIQQSYFPPLSELHHLKDAFLYHAPRDIVSGDFYWFKFLGDKMVISISDCTGHGVPGAFMSLIGMTLLDQIVGKDGVLNPAEALKRIDRGIIKAFENSDTESNDGMDMALITIDFKKKNVMYAGAFRPLIYVSNGEMTEIKATKTSLGGSFEVKEKDFELHEINYSDGDCIYLYTDGYADQFGGEDKKKFKSKVLKDMLLAGSAKTMDEQKQIVDQRLCEWKGIHDQVDDILVFGVRL